MEVIEIKFMWIINYSAQCTYSFLIRLSDLLTGMVLSFTGFREFFQVCFPDFFIYKFCFSEYELYLFTRASLNC